jgi:hypothetical protein
MPDSNEFNEPLAADKAGESVAAIATLQSTKPREAAYLLGRLLNFQHWLRMQASVGPASDQAFNDVDVQLQICLVKVVKRHAQPALSDAINLDRRQWEEWYESLAAEIFAENLAPAECVPRMHWLDGLNQLVDRLRTILNEDLWLLVRFGATIDQGVRRLRLLVDEPLESLFPSDVLQSVPRFDEVWWTELYRDRPEDLALEELAANAIQKSTEGNTLLAELSRLDSSIRAKFRRTDLDDDHTDSFSVPKPGYLDLIVDTSLRTVGRVGHDTTIELTGPKWWIFYKIYQAEGRALFWHELESQYPFEHSARHQAVAKLRHKIEKLGLTIVPKQLQFEEATGAVKDSCERHLSQKLGDCDRQA